MALLSWSNQYKVGNDLIDNEHQELFRKINDFHDHWREQRKVQAIAALLNQLITYAEMHFQHEEAIMRDAGFPRLEEHQAVHEAMVVTIFHLRQTFEENNGRVEMETMKFIRNWLIEHIVRNDYLFRDFLARRNGDVAANTPPITSYTSSGDIDAWLSFSRTTRAKRWYHPAQFARTLSRTAS